MNTHGCKRILLDKLEDTLEIAGFVLADLIRVITKNTASEFEGNI